MELISNLTNVWNNGTTTPHDLSPEEIAEFRTSAGAREVVKSRWIYQGRPYETIYYVSLLKDRTGLVHFQDDDIHSHRLVVRNGDNSIRTVIDVPRISDASKPEIGYLSLPPSSAHYGGIEWGCAGNDGDADYLFDFDWNSGKLLRFAKATRTW